MALLTLFLQLFAAVRKRFRPWHKFLQVFLWNIILGILFQLFHQKLKILKRIQPIGFRCFCNRIQECTCLCSFLGIYDVPAMFPNAELFDAAFRVIIIQRNNSWSQKDSKIFFPGSQNRSVPSSNQLRIWPYCSGYLLPTQRKHQPVALQIAVCYQESPVVICPCRDCLYGK